MASDSELDRNTIFEKFASIKRMHVEVGKKQTEDYQKRLQKLKEEESNYMAKLLSQQAPSRPQQDIAARVQTSARRDLFLTSKNDGDQLEMSIPQQQQHYPSYKPTNRSSSHHPDSFENGDHDWNIDDDFQPLNITDNEVLDERTSNRLINDDEPEDSYIQAYHQLLQTHHQQQQQQIMSQQEQENMLSTILEASCEDATPMTSLVDVHQHRIPPSSSKSILPISKNDHINDSEEEEEEEDDDDDDEETEYPIAPSFAALDEIPVSTAFSKNENLKYSEYIHEKLQVEKDEAFINQNQTSKEKRPFLRRRQGLAHFQAPPKRRQRSPKTNDNNNHNTKNETIKRPASANNHSRSTTTTTTNNNLNQRSRSHSSSSSILSGRQTPNSTTATSSRLSSKTKTTKQNSTKSTLPNSSNLIPSNLLGKVDLDDEDDLLTKYQSKKISIEQDENDDEFTATANNVQKKSILNIQTMIDSKWNAYKKPVDNSEEGEDDEELYSHIRPRTSSHSSGIQTKVTITGNPTSVHHKTDLDDFEQLEQYAEEHPSMISTASYVEQVVLKDHHLSHNKDHQRQKTADLFVHRLTHYHEEETDVNPEENNNFLSSSNRIRQRKIKPFKSKVDARIEQLTAKATIASDEDDEDDYEDHKWDDVGVAKVIPVVADEYNSDSGISSLKTDFHKQQQKKDSARSSDFDDEKSWIERVTAPAHNTLMLKTFPGLRHTVPTPATVPPPPPPPPPSEPNQDLSRLMREKSKELEKQIDIFQKENTKLESLCNERNLAIKKLKQDRDEFEKMKEKQSEEFNQMKDEEIKRLKQEKRLFEQHRQQLRDHPDKREREEIEILKKQVLALQEDLKQRETRWSTTINRLKERIETLEYENAELKQEKDIIERKRLDLMYQLQTTSKQPPLQEDTSRKSLIELQQTKRPKSAVSTTTTKTQSLPKTMVVRNSEPSNKSKITSNGRRTPTTIVGVNGIKNNIDTSRKLSSLPPTKRTNSTTELTETIESIIVTDQPIVISERVDSGNGGSDEDIHRFDRQQLFDRNDEHLSPALSGLVNSDYPKSFIDDDESVQQTTLDYKSLLTMATRTSSSATTLLKQHHQTLSLLDQSTLKQQQPLPQNNHDSTIPISRSVSHPSTKSITFKENFSSLPTNHEVEEIRHNDGRIERIKPDMSKQIIFPNGSKQDISADGKQIRVQFYNGDYKEKMSDGRCVYKYASTNTTETEYPDGTRIYEFPNGQIEKHLPDGRQEHTLPDQTKNIYLTDGTIISLKTNGEKLIQHSNQTKEIHTDTYKRKIFSNGSILTVFNTGEQEVRYPNGKIKIKDAHGNIIVDKKISDK